MQSDAVREYEKKCAINALSQFIDSKSQIVRFRFTFDLLYREF